MSLPITIKDSEGTGYQAGVTKDHALKVTIITPSAASSSLPELVALTARKQLRVFATNVVGGGTDLNINAAATPVEFKVVADPTTVRWFTSARVLFNGVNLEMDSQDFRRFGAATSIGAALTNGVTLFTQQAGAKTDFFISPIVRMGDFFDVADSFLNIKNSISASSDFLSFDYVFDVPIVLVPGSVDEITARINDDLTAIDRFKVIFRGYQELL
jgi:hypothetical protein